MSATDDEVRNFVVDSHAAQGLEVTSVQLIPLPGENVMVVVDTNDPFSTRKGVLNRADVAAASRARGASGSEPTDSIGGS